MDCFCIGRLSGTKDTVWQYTAIDVASAYTWASLQVTPPQPLGHWTSTPARRVAADLAERGWRLEQVMRDNATEFRSTVFQQTLATLGAQQTFIRPGRPQTNGCGAGPADHPGRVLEASLRPLPHTQQTGLRLDLEHYLRRYNTERVHTGRWTKGHPPKPSSARPSYGTTTADASPQLEDRTG